MRVPNGRRRGAPLLLAAATAAALVTGCAETEGNSDDPVSAADSEATLGTPNQATGTPVIIGFIGDGKGDALDNTDEYKAAVAAAMYANDYLGGIGGNPIEVKVCEARQIPAAATDCANQMVTAGAAAVVEGTLAEVDRTIEVLAPAGIPLLMNSGATEAVMNTPGVFSLFNALSIYGAPASYAQSEGVEKAALVVIAVPAAEGVARGPGAMLYDNVGIETDVIAIAPGTADMTPQITTASQNDPQIYNVNGNDSFCTSAFKAIRSIEPDAKITALDRCIAPAAASSIPGGYEGVEVVTVANLSPDTEDAKLFSAILDKYGDGARYGSGAAFGYGPMLGMIQALNAAGVTEVNPETVVSGMQSAPALDYPLGGGLQFQCNGEMLALSANICSSDGIMATSDAEGNLSDYRIIPADPELYAPAG